MEALKDAVDYGVIGLSHPRESLVVLRADRVTVLEPFVAVVDEVRGLGFKQVSLEE